MDQYCWRNCKGQICKIWLLTWWGWRWEFPLFIFIYSPLADFSSRPQDPVLSTDRIDFYDIPKDGIQELSELDECLAQPIEKCRDPIAWWWEHCEVLPRLSSMAFNYLSIPCMFFIILVYCILYWPLKFYSYFNTCQESVLSRKAGAAFHEESTFTCFNLGHHVLRWME